MLAESIPYSGKNRKAKNHPNFSVWKLKAAILHTFSKSRPKC
jgi:hypothetical protein